MKTQDVAKSPTEHRRLAKGCLVGYVVLLLATLPIALPLWNNWLKERIGPAVSIEQIHLIQYCLLGGLICFYAVTGPNPRKTLTRLLGVAAGVGLADECIQGLLPGRFFQWMDVALNWGGILISAGPVWIYLKRFRPPAN